MSHEHRTDDRRFPAWLLAAGLTLCGATSVLAGPGPMQVEEPDLSESKPPIQPEKDQAGWKAKNSALLTPDQQAALKSRQETMKDMMILIQQKRRALREARPEDREVLARELHNLILEKAQVTERGHGQAVHKAARKAIGIPPMGTPGMRPPTRTRESGKPARGHPTRKSVSMNRWRKSSASRKRAVSCWKNA